MGSQQIQIDPDTQKRLNEPLAKSGGLSTQDQAFLSSILEKVDSHKIDLFRPSSLINTPVYEKLSEEQQAKVEMDAFNLIATLRTIYDLWKYYQTPTFQIENLVHSVRLTKERLEEISGDIFII